MGMNIKYIENLAKEMAIAVANEGGFKNVKLENGTLSVNTVELKNKRLIEMANKLDKKDNNLLDKIFQEEFNKILKAGIKTELRRKTLEEGIAKKWN